MKTFIVAFQIPQAELDQLRREEGIEARYSDAAVFAAILQRDLYDESGLAGEFQVLTPHIGWAGQPATDSGNSPPEPQGPLVIYCGNRDHDGEPLYWSESAGREAPLEDATVYEKPERKQYQLRDGWEWRKLPS